MMPNPAKKSYRRRLRVMTAVMAIFAMVLSTTAAYAAEPSPRTPSAGHHLTLPVTSNDDLVRRAASSGVTLPLTLITGDKLDVGINAQGKPVVRDIRPAARPDGSTVAFHTITRGGSVHVVPNDALSLLGSGLLDWGLFDLTKLAAHVANGTVGEVPVLVTYTQQGAAKAAPKVAGAATKKTLSSINGRSMSIAGDGKWWQQVRGKTDEQPGLARSVGALAGVQKVWLNELARVSLDTSVPQIGAPIAWDRGYDGTGVTVAVLDTGIDATHPDVAGKVIEQVNFLNNTNEAKDGHGHGTHVSATILGTGAASNGLRKGVAPGAKLLTGKVCNDGGSCPTDAIIAGMEWAANSQARVVNMSLGSGPTDGTDPLSSAVNNLSRSTGTLFVVAAGNSGPSSGTVGAPGAADEALTVAAVDKADEMASFSSRGPRLGDGAAKPDIAAPGVNIVAARAAGTAMGTVVDEHYTTASGTSMATPHVAGAAAIIAGKYPTMTGQAIKGLLMGTATDLGHDLYAQGAGRVNVGAAIDPSIISGGNLAFGRHAYPHSPATKTITYSNTTDQAITLSLSASAASGTNPAPAGLFTLSADEVTVPANGSVQVTVTMDGRVLGSDGVYGAYSGVLNGRDSAGALRATARISSFLEPQRHDLTVKVVRPAGATQVRYGNAVVIPVDDKVTLHDGPVEMAGADSMTAGLFAGTFSAAVFVEWKDTAGEWHSAVPLVTDVEVSKATSVTLDLNAAKPIGVRLPERTETYDAVSQFERTSATGAWGMTSELVAAYGADEPNWWALPTGAARLGTLTSRTSTSQVTPVVSLQAIGGGDILDLSARYHTPDVSIDAGSQSWSENEQTVSRDIAVPVPRLATSGTLPVVYAGAGTAEELAAVDAKGKLVLLTPTDICNGACTFPSLRDRVAAAAGAGAVGVLVAAPGLTSLGTVPTQSVTCSDGPESCPAVQPYAALPIVSVAYDKAKQLIRRLGAAAPVQIKLGGSAKPTAYAVTLGDRDHISGDLPYEVKQRDLSRVDHAFHADRAGELVGLAVSWVQQTESGASVTASLDLPLTATQQALTTFVTRQENAINRFEVMWADHVGPSLLGASRVETQELAPAGRNQLRWNTGPTVPGAASGVRASSGTTVGTGTLCSGCRQGDTFYPNFYVTSSGGGRQQLVGVVNNAGFSEFWFGLPACEGADCDFSLFNASGDELERRLVPVSIGLGR